MSMELINRNNLLYRIDEKMQEIEKSEHRAIRSDEVLRCIVTQHVEDAVPIVHAYLIPTMTEDIGTGEVMPVLWKCSKCGNPYVDCGDAYCCKCGAKLDGKDDEK